MSHGIRLIAAFAILVLGAACGDGSQTASVAQGAAEAGYAETERAREACQRVARTHGGPDTVMAAAFETTVSAMGAWQRDIVAADRRASGQPDPGTDQSAASESEFVRSRPKHEWLAVCYFDGPVYLPMPADKPEYNRARYLIDSKGETIPDAAGYHDVPGEADMELEDPESRRAP